MNPIGRLLLALLVLIGGLLLVLALREEPSPAGAEATAERTGDVIADASTAEDAPLAAPQLPVPSSGSSSSNRVLGGDSAGGPVLRGRLLDELGAPVADAKIVVTQVTAEALQQARATRFKAPGVNTAPNAVAGRVTPSPVHQATARTDEKGRFEVPHLEPHALTVRATEQPSSPEATQVPGAVNARRSVSMSLDNPDEEIELRLPRGESLTGLVVGPAGRPIDDIRVTATRSSGDGVLFPSIQMPQEPTRGSNVWGQQLPSDSAGQTVQGRFTGEDGRFRFEGLEAGQWNVVVTKGEQRAIRSRPDGGLNTFQASEVVQLPHSGLVRIVLPLPARLEGVVRTTFGDPAAFALVELTGLSKGADDKRWATDEDGRFEIMPVVRGARYRITAQHKDHAASEPREVETSATGDSPPLDLRLRAAARLSGRVHAGHAQRSWRLVVLSGPTSASAPTDADGRFAFEGLTPGEYRVELAAARIDGDGDAATQALALTEGENAQIVLGGTPAPGIRVFGVVRSGDAVREGLDVTLSGGGSTVRGATNAAGRYELEVEAPGAYVLRLADGAQSVRLALEVPDAHQLRHDVDLATGSISGRVTNREGAPLASVALSLSGEASAATTTAADGTYSFGFLSAGDYAVRLLAPDEPDPSAESLATTLATGEERTGLDLRLERPTRIEGRAWLRTIDSTKVTNSTAAGATVRLRFADGRAIATTRSDAKGTFTFEAVPHGALVVEASIEDATAEVHITCAPGESTPVELRLERDDD